MLEAAGLAISGASIFETSRRLIADEDITTTLTVARVVNAIDVEANAIGDDSQDNSGDFSGEDLGDSSWIEVSTHDQLDRHSNLTVLGIFTGGVVLAAGTTLRLFNERKADLVNLPTTNCASEL